MIFLFLSNSINVVKLLYEKILTILIKNNIEFYFYSTNNENSLKIINNFNKEIKKYQDKFITNIDIIRKKEISHIFYQVCYCCYYPDHLRTYNIKKIYTNAKICFTNYGYSMINHKFLHGAGEDPYFFGYCDYFFQENELNKKHHIERICESIKKINMPHDKIKFETIGCIKQDLVINIERKKNIDGFFYIMWCPRWHKHLNLCSYDLYIDYFINLINDNKKIKLIFRPHPLTNYSLNKILDASKKNPNIIIDKSLNYYDNFKFIDVFISDPSTLLAEALGLEIPIIYTEKQEKIFNDFGNLVKDSFYIVKDISKIDETIKNLIEGKDDKKYLRQKYKKEFYDKYKNPCEELIKILIKDHNETTSKEILK